MVDSSRSPRRIAPRKLATLTAGAALGLAVAGAAQAAGTKGFDATGPEKLWLAVNQGGESGMAVEMLTDLGLVEGHLRAGVALYQAGLADQAVGHMKHPQDEIYADLAAHLEDAGIAGFAEELTALAATVEERADAGDVEAAFAAVMTKVEEARGAADAGAAGEAQAMLALVRTAADEYGEGVADGAVKELHEYQDAWGFVQVARTMAEHMAAESAAGEKAFGAKALSALDEIAPALPGVSPEGRSLGDAGMVLAAAAKIELAAYGLK